ncbi:uncharacterized protein TRAVEDRAFT_42458 [Trametes versicolor FP-101664 SS1]|uniref:uncharacterized protein n=1 Tax=Trametes versicolor (strain FP-101664) TaxID=717944 RepID=UPI0004621F07|nr:uncharacterized protein TRAVEDRAFT_42458 [Trametes versicolor FP-101664 SS1]EIW65064.1 hypothetical protein TRAVEDRAFT_42458 [Trametes versicolor FP-101664 SS1]
MPGSITTAPSVVDAVRPRLRRARRAAPRTSTPTLHPGDASQASADTMTSSRGPGRVLPARRGAIEGDRYRLVADDFRVQRPYIAHPIAVPPRVAAPLGQITTGDAGSGLCCVDALAEALSMGTIMRTPPSPPWRVRRLWTSVHGCVAVGTS